VWTIFYVDGLTATNVKISRQEQRAHSALRHYFQCRN
jgi:hypothetical protein